ncbi:hypothetical protein TNCV_674312 [Trichonephila clavipes]|nr:hypothetical protein TNCV_674312 [Trichonephila clavipes]
MNSRRETSENERALVIKWSKDGNSLQEIASLIGKSHGCIQNIVELDVWPIFQEEGAKRKIIRSKTDGLRYVESRSSDKIDSQIGTLPSKFPHHIRVRTLTCDRFNVYQPFYHVRLTT